MSQLSALKKPSRLDQARIRVDAALSDLENALENSILPGCTLGGSQPGHKLEQENAILRKRNQTLTKQNSRIVSRLDDVIARLKAAAR